VTLPLRVLVTLNPHVAGSGVWRHAVLARRGRYPNVNAKGDLGFGSGSGTEEQSGDCECLNDFSHARIVRHTAASRLCSIAHEMFTVDLHARKTSTPLAA